MGRPVDVRRGLGALAGLAALAAGLVLGGCDVGGSELEPVRPSAGDGADARPGVDGSRRPNLVLVLTDDQRYDTLGCNGNAGVPTPHIDRLAREGARFRRAYVITSLCCPARATLQTGLYTHVSGVRNNEDEVDLLREHEGFAERLQGAGYETAFFGKWHIPNPDNAAQPGYDHWVSFEGRGAYQDETFTLISDGQRQDVQLAGFSTDVLTNMACQWIERERDAPFCLVLSVKNLHRPFEPPARHTGALADVAFPPPPTLDEPVEALPAVVRRAREGKRNGGLEDVGEREALVRGYHELVLSVDDAVGRLTETLDAAGVLDDTALILTSDGGYLWGEHGLYRKRAAYEPSIHVPLVVRLPGEVPAGTVVDELALNLDLCATLCELGGVDPPAGQQGRSLTALWRGPADDWREDFVYLDGWGKVHDGPLELALVGERLKYVRYRSGAIEERLFDLAADPHEARDLAADPGHADDLARARARLAEALAEVDAPSAWLEPSGR